MSVKNADDKVHKTLNRWSGECAVKLIQQTEIQFVISRDDSIAQYFYISRLDLELLRLPLSSIDFTWNRFSLIIISSAEVKQVLNVISRIVVGKI